jgi:uncharacterized protein (TIGR03435 family)
MMHAILGPISVCIAAVCAFAQAPVPSFEVASVKRTQHGRTPDGWSHSSLKITGPGRFLATNASLHECIRWAYEIKDYQLSGPDWLASDEASFDIEAMAPPGTPEKQMRLMAQALLAERFKLALHRETRQLPVYLLTVAKKRSETPGGGR